MRNAPDSPARRRGDTDGRRTSSPRPDPPADSRRPTAWARVRRRPATVLPEAEHAATGCRANRLAPARPQSLERRHDPLPGPRPGPLRDLEIELLQGQIRCGQGLVDGGDDRVGLLGVEPDLRREAGCFQRRIERRVPHRQVGRGQQMDRPARADRLHERSFLPERTTDVDAGRAGNADADRDLGRRHHLGMGAADRRDLFEHPIGGNRRREAMPVEPADPRRIPGQSGRSTHRPSCRT